MRRACALQRFIQTFAIDLLAMPRLRDVLDPFFAGVLHQCERQRLRVWTAELVSSSQFTILWALAACFPNCDGVASDSNIAPDLSLWLRAYYAKASVGINRPDRV